MPVCRTMIGSGPLGIWLLAARRAWVALTQPLGESILRQEVAHRVNMKFAPDLRFRLDERFDEAERIDKLLRSPSVKRDLEGDDHE